MKQTTWILALLSILIGSIFLTTSQASPMQGQISGKRVLWDASGVAPAPGGVCTVSPSGLDPVITDVVVYRDGVKVTPMNWNLDMSSMPIEVFISPDFEAGDKILVLGHSATGNGGHSSISF